MSFVVRHAFRLVLVAFLFFGLLVLPIHAGTLDVLVTPSFTVDAKTLLATAATVNAEKEMPATVLLQEIHFSFDAKGALVLRQHLIYRIENQRGVDNWAEVTAHWETWHQDKPEIRARVVTTDGSEHWLDPKTLKDFPLHEDQPDIYDDDRNYGGPLPAVAVGSIIEQETVERDITPAFVAGTAERWVLAWRVPCAMTVVTITHPNGLFLKVQPHNLGDATVTKSTLNGNETITFNQGPLRPTGPTMESTPPELALYPEIEFSTGNSWQQVGQEYARISDEKIRTTDVQFLLAQLDLKSGTRTQRIRKIVAALHRSVRYTGLEFGESKLVPQFPSETLRRRYGDCKDKATLLVTMLRAAGIPANLALLDAGPGRDLNPELPGIGMFNHAIVHVPADGGEPEMWIDATAQFQQVGTLPWMDYGRWALIVDGKSEGLTRIPRLTAEQNVHIEHREFTLAEYGHASILESDDAIGPEQGDYRSYYASGSKEVRQSSENYVKTAYLADSLTSLQHEDLADLEKPGTIQFLCKGGRGNTDLTSAVAAIRIEALFNVLPKYFRTKPDAKKETGEDDEENDDNTPRTVDWYITPFTTEWHYKIVAPLGFKVRALPSDRDETIGMLRFTQKYVSNAGGSIVEAVLRVENTHDRLTVKQATDLRDAVVKAQNSDPIFITFDHSGNSLISAGKIKEGLAIYAQIAEKHPKEALHQVQLSQVLLQVGLGEQARAAAKTATGLEPNSALAYSTLGAALKHDLVGRPLKKGMDYAGAVAAYRRAIELDPKDKDTRANFALLLEYGADGERYNNATTLKESIEQIKKLRELDADYARRYDENVLYDLWYIHDYQGLLDYAKDVSGSDARRGLVLGATVILKGLDAALKTSMELTQDEDTRQKALATAGIALMRVRKYPEASAILSAIPGANSQMVNLAAMLARTKRREELKMDPNDPRGVVLELFSKMMSGDLTFDEARRLVRSGPSDDISGDEKEFHRTITSMKTQLSNTGLPLINIADIALSNMHFTVEGDDTIGYKIILEAPGSKGQEVFVVKDGASYRVAAFARGETDVEGLAEVALDALSKGNLAVARTWLDRARDIEHMSDTDDPLSGQPFPHFWTKGNQADAEAVRTAALVLLKSEQLKGAYVAQLDTARRKAEGIDRARLTMVLAYGYAAHSQWSQMLPLAQELVKQYPTSQRAYQLAARAYSNLNLFDDWQSLVDARIQEHPDDLDYTRGKASLELWRGDYRMAREIMKRIIDKGRATDSDLNFYAWYALYLPGPVLQDSIETAQRASELTKNGSFATLHTLACVDAAAGHTAEARDLLLKAMEKANLEEPDDAVWLGFAMIAEQYGVVDAADEMFRRVEKTKQETPGSNYQLAQQHIAALARLTSKAATMAGK